VVQFESKRKTLPRLDIWPISDWKQTVLVAMTGAAWLSSACDVNCTLNWGNMRNPHDMLNCTYQTAGVNPEEGGDDVKSAWLLRLGRHACYNGQYNGLPTREGELIPKNWSQFGLESATRLHEVGIASKCVSATAH